MGAANAAYTGPVLVTCTNGAFWTGWDNSNQFFQGRGNIAALYCQIVHNTGYVSDNLSDPHLRWYGGIVLDTSTSVQESVTPVSVSDSSTVQPQQVETSTQSSETQTSTSTQTQVSDTQTSSQDTLTASVESQSVSTDSLTSIAGGVETQTLVDTSTASTQETSTTTIPNTESPTLPTPVPVVEPQPVVVAEPQPVPQPEPEPVVSETQTVEVPLEQEQSSEELPTVEEQLPVEEPTAPPVEEDTSDLPTEDEKSEPPLEPSTEPVVEPEPASQVDTAYEPPTVTLDNGVILSQEVAEQVELLQNPSEFMSELFTDPMAALAALGSVGADMSPKAREQSKKAVVQAVIVGGIVSQVAGAASYRRKP